jgi:hypothetical protein
MTKKELIDKTVETLERIPEDNSRNCLLSRFSAG